MKTKTKPANTRKQQKKKIIIASIAIGAAGILGYFGWQYFKKKRRDKDGADLDEALKASIPSPVYKSTTASATSKKPGPSKPMVANPYATTDADNFPLKKGSRGNKVRLLQEALIAKYGKNALPKYGADGDFRGETVNALKKAGLPAVITESVFNVLTASVKANTGSIGKELYAAAIAKNYNKVLSLLKQLQSASDYSAANETFKQNRINGVRQTIVNGLLNVFTNSAQKEAIKFEFLRMGLQFDGNKWSLSGLDGKAIVTKESTTVWVNAMEGVKVPARMVLGSEVTRRLDYTLFENNGKYFLVNTRSVTYLNT